MINAVNDSLLFVIEIIKRFINWFLNTTVAKSYLLPLFAVGIAISVLFASIKIIKGSIWGS